MLRYHIKYTWPNGKVRYRLDSRLCKTPEEASVFTLIEASAIMKQSRDARIVWDIHTSKEACHDNPILPLLYDPEPEPESPAPKRRTRKKRSRKPQGS